MTKTKRRRNWRDLKVLFENFQSEYVAMLGENMDLCGSDTRFKFGEVVDLLSGLRGLTQDFVSELEFVELIDEAFGDTGLPKLKGADLDEIRNRK